MRRSATAVGGLLLGAAAVLSAAPTSVAAATAVEWSASHGSATASGTRWTEPRSTGSGTVLVVKGELRNSGTGCYSVWVQWRSDFIVHPYTKQATQCGTGATPVEVRREPYQLTTTGSLMICRGSTDTSDCGNRESLTTWPIQS